MKLTVFGSTGRTGMALIAQALDAGYDVTAYARNPAKVRVIDSDRLEVVEGELGDRPSMERAIAGADAVISVLGPGGKVSDTALSDGTKNIVDAMKSVGVDRLVAISTGSVKDAQDRPDFVYGLLVALIKLGVRGAYDEIIRMGDVVRSSELKWTLVRVGLLDDGELRPIRVGHYGRGEVKLAVSRQSVAKFMLDQSDSEEYVGQAPAISN